MFWTNEIAPKNIIFLPIGSQKKIWPIRSLQNNSFFWPIALLWWVAAGLCYTRTLTWVSWIQRMRSQFIRSFNSRTRSIFANDGQFLSSVKIKIFFFAHSKSSCNTDCKKDYSICSPWIHHQVSAHHLSNLILPKVSLTSSSILSSNGDLFIQNESVFRI